MRSEIRYFKSALQEIYMGNSDSNRFVTVAELAMLFSRAEQLKRVDGGCTCGKCPTPNVHTGERV